MSNARRTRRDAGNGPETNRTPAKTPLKTRDSSVSAAPRAALGAPGAALDAELARVVAAWPTLPPHVRTAIATLIGPAAAPAPASAAPASETTPGTSGNADAPDGR